MRSDNEGRDGGLLSAAAHAHRTRPRPVSNALRKLSTLRARISVHGVRQAAAGAANGRSPPLRHGRALPLRALLGNHPSACR